MAVDLVELIKPSDFDLNKPFFGSSFNDYNMESVARNVVVVCMKRDNSWKPFSFQEYRSLANHVAIPAEQETLNWFVEQELMSFENGRYEVKHEFIAALAEFLEKKQTGT